MTLILQFSAKLVRTRSSRSGQLVVIFQKVPKNSIFDPLLASTPPPAPTNPHTNVPPPPRPNEPHTNVSPRPPIYPPPPPPPNVNPLPKLTQPPPQRTPPTRDVPPSRNPIYQRTPPPPNVPTYPLYCLKNIIIIIHFQSIIIDYFFFVETDNENPI